MYLSHHWWDIYIAGITSLLYSCEYATRWWLILPLVWQLYRGYTLIPNIENILNSSKLVELITKLGTNILLSCIQFGFFPYSHFGDTRICIDSLFCNTQFLSRNITKHYVKSLKRVKNMALRLLMLVILSLNMYRNISLRFGKSKNIYIWIKLWFFISKPG